jgi:hypothetical protein
MKLAVSCFAVLYSLVEGCDFTEALAASIIKSGITIVLMIEEANICDTLVNLYEATRPSIQEDSHLHSCCRENLRPRRDYNALEAKYSNTVPAVKTIGLYV